jgi:hypothetical protein
MDENLEPNGTEVQETQDTPELSPVEQRALEMGWRPKEEWTGEEADFISAETFVARKPLFDKIEYQNRELKEVRKALAALQEHHIRVKEQAFKDAYVTLKEEKKAALAEGDADKLIEVDEKIAELRSQEIEQKAVNNTPPSQQLNPTFVSWVEKNDWYVDNKKSELRAYADAVGIKIAQEDPGKSPEALLREVEKQVKVRFKEYFQNDRKDRPSAVEGSSPRTSSKSNDDFKLSEDDERAMKKFVRLGIMTKEEFIADLKALEKGKGN